MFFGGPDASLLFSMRKIVRQHGVWWATGRKITQWKNRGGFTRDQWDVYYGVILAVMMIAE